MTTQTILVQPVVKTYPTLVKRIQSMFVDLLFILGLMFAISAIIDRTGDAPDWLRAALFIGLWFVYEPIAVTFGCTIGQYIIGLRVRKARDETKKINILQSIIRFVLKTVLGWLSFLTIHTNEQRRAIHDLAAGSVMTQIVRPEEDED